MSFDDYVNCSVSTSVKDCIGNETIPVIDVGKYLSGDIEAREQFAVDLRAIQESLGFFVIVNHGVEQSLIDHSFEEVAKLFALPLDIKMKYQVGYHHIGYIPDRAMITRPHDVDIHGVHNNTSVDINEGWAFMRERNSDDPKVIANVRHRGLNKWPEELPSFRPVLRQYQESMTSLALQMLPAYARALEMPADYFNDKFTNPEYHIRCSWYPPSAIQNECFSLAPHADHSSMTYLPLMEVPGLEVMSPSGKWIQVEPLRGGIVVNTGEFLNRWSNGRFIATPHRVVPPKRDRYALTFFFNCDDETVADPLPTCIFPGDEPKYDPMTFHEYQISYLDGNYTYHSQ